MVKSFPGFRHLRRQYIKGPDALAKSLLTKSGYRDQSESIMAADIDDKKAWATVIDDRPVSHIIALDCAYHFPNRSRFFDHAHSHLEAGGKIALTDFILSDRKDHNIAHKLLLCIMFSLSRIPRSNMMDKTSYQ